MKSQDVLLLCLLIANKESRRWTQAKLGSELKRSPSTINASLKRLEKVHLIIRNEHVFYFPNRFHCLEYLRFGVHYFFHDKQDIMDNVRKTLDEWKAAKDVYDWNDI